MVVPSAAISSRVAGTPSRRSRSRSLISAASRRIRSTGRSAAPAKSHAPMPAAAPPPGPEQQGQLNPFDGHVGHDGPGTHRHDDRAPPRVAGAARTRRAVGADLRA